MKEREGERMSKRERELQIYQFALHAYPIPLQSDDAFIGIIENQLYMGFFGRQANLSQPIVPR